MTYTEARGLLAFLINAMPKGYPRPRLVLHESPESLVEFVYESRENHRLAHGYSAALVLAVSDPGRNCIHTTEPTLMEAPEEIALVFLHELSHLRAAAKDIDDTEASADAFARRWWKKLKPRMNGGSS